MGRLENPETQTRPVTLEGIERNGEIWVFIARYFNNYHAVLRPGEQLAIGLEALNGRLRLLYDPMEFPCGFAIRFCIGAAALTWAENRAIWITSYLGRSA